MTTTLDSNPTELAEKLQTLEQQLNQLQDQLVRAQRLALLGTMAGMIAHEFNNLLTPVVSYAQYALTQDDHELWRKALTRAYESGEKAADVAQQILGFARGELENQEADTKEVAESAIKALVRDLSKDNITLTMEVEPVAVEIQGHLFQQVLYNLIINARQAMLGRPGRLTVRSRTDQTTVWIDVTDTGCGIEGDVIEQIFTPFFTTKSKADNPEMQGTGLGLAISRSIVEQADGTLTVQSTPGEGTCFTITLPRSAE